jgi:hypothetical protein
VEYDFAAVWCCVGHAAFGERDVWEKGQPVDDANLADVSVVFNVVSMEGTECTQF